MGETQAPGNVVGLPQPPGAPAQPPAEQLASRQPRDIFIALADKVLLLRVTTVVGPAQVQINTALDRGLETVITMPAGSDHLVASTAANMLTGDFTQVFSQPFVDQPALAKLHADALAQAHQTRDKTVAIIGQIATFVAAKV